MTRAAEIAPLLAAARTAWPDVAAPADRFEAAVERAVAAGERVERLSAAGLWLAVACRAGDLAALRHLDRLLVPVVNAIVSKSRGVAIEAEDLRQLVSQRLLVGEPGRPPKIDEYLGQGELTGWLRVVATRLWVDVARKRSGNEAVHDDERAAEALFAQGGDPELDYLKAHYRLEFARAFREALAALDPGDRTLLRQHLVERLGIDQLAVAHGVHRATAARRVQAAKEALLADTRRRLMQALSLGRAELESVMRMIESQLHVSVARLLG